MASIGCTVPPPKLWVFSSTTSAVSTWYGPTPVVTRDIGPAGSSRPRSLGHERLVMPEKTAAGAHLGPQHVRLLVGDELLPGADVQPHAELVGQRPGRREEPGLVAEQVGDLLLERADRGVLAEHVVADDGVGHRLAHGGRRSRQGVRQEVGAHRVSPR